MKIILRNPETNQEEEIIFTNENSKALSLRDNITIYSKDFNYNRKKNRISKN